MMDPKIVFPFAVNKERENIILFDSVNTWGYNYQGADYIDLSLGSCGCFPLGFKRTDFVDFVHDKLKDFPHLSGEFLTTNKYVVELGEKLYKLSNGYRSLFTTSGSDAVESAVKVARQVQGKDKNILLGFENSYHGSTYISQSIGGVTYLHEQYGRDSNCYSLPWDLDLAETKIQELSQKGICCLIVETCSWHAGLYSYDDAWWQRLRQLCDKFSIVLIVDDIAFCGGKTGSFFGYNKSIEPDIVCIGKALTGGYFPLAGCLISDKVYSVIKETTFLNGFSYSFNMSGILSALHYINIVEQENLLEQYHIVRARATEMFDNVLKYKSVTAIRNFGLTWCIDIDSDLISNNSDLLKLFLSNGMYLGLWNSHKKLLIAVPSVLDENYFIQLEARLASSLNTV